MKKYTLTISKKQLEIMEQALHSYARMQVGQLTTALDPVTWNDEIKSKLNETQQGWLNQLTLYEHNEMHGHTEESEIAWDVYQVLRHQLWKENPNRTKHSVTDFINENHSVYKRGIEELPELEVKDSD